MAQAVDDSNGVPGFFETAAQRTILVGGVKVALVVGPILCAINQGDVILAGSAPDFLKLGLTFMVPFCVSVYSATRFSRNAARAAAMGGRRTTDRPA